MQKCPEDDTDQLLKELQPTKAIKKKKQINKIAYNYLKNLIANLIAPNTHTCKIPKPRDFTVEFYQVP